MCSGVVSDEELSAAAAIEGLRPHAEDGTHVDAYDPSKAEPQLGKSVVDADTTVHIRVRREAAAGCVRKLQERAATAEVGLSQQHATSQANMVKPTEEPIGVVELGA